MYTLAYNGTNKSNKTSIIVSGVGSDLGKKDALKARAKRKAITQAMMLGLIDIAGEDEEPEMVKAFWNTYYCLQKVTTANGKLYGTYCKNRFCTVCCSIRKADIINRYYPTLSQWSDAQFVTITVKACKANQLERYFRNLKTTFSKIVAKHRKRHQRGKGIKLVGIKSLESNYNPVAKTYNPHFHIIVQTKEMADVIVKEWHERAKKGYVSLKAQEIKSVWNLDKALVEIIKYGSKIFTDSDLKKRAKETTTPKVYLKAIYTIFKAMKGSHIFDRFGFDLPKGIKKEQLKTKLLSDYETWEHDSYINDWQSVNTDEVLTGFEMPSQLQAMLAHNLNDQMH